MESTMDDPLNDLVTKAQQGNREALEAVVAQIQDTVHHLAMRMLVDRDDAEDATQDILILIVTKLSTFSGKSKFTTWVYRVALNHLLTAKKIAQREKGLTFEMFGADLEVGLIPDPGPSAEDLLMLNELRIFCTMAMLLCLDMNHRAAYVLGDILEFDHREASEILEITPDNYRKRLSRARDEVVRFTSKACGLASADAKCSCPRRLHAATAHGCVSPGQFIYANPGAPGYAETSAAVSEVIGELKVLKLQRATGFYGSPKDYRSIIHNLGIPNARKN